MEFLRLHPSSANVTASQSSNSGCACGPLAADAEVVRRATRPSPKCHCETRFTITRAVSGFFGSAIHSAQPRRRDFPGRDSPLCSRDFAAALDARHRRVGLALRGPGNFTSIGLVR